jgi:hypothetical protein
MITLRRCGILNTLRARTSVEEVLRMTADDVSEAQATPRLKRPGEPIKEILDGD